MPPTIKTLIETPYHPQDPSLPDILVPTERGSVLRQYINLQLQLTDAPAIFHMGCGLTLMASVANPFMKFRFGAESYINLYCLLVGRSGNVRKTTCVSNAKKLLLKAVPERVGDNPGSYEALYGALVDRPSQMVPWGEFGKFMKDSAGKGHLAGLKTGLTELYDGVAQPRITVRSGKQEVSNPRVSLLGGVNLVYFAQYSDHEDFTGGHYSRYLILEAGRHRSLYPLDAPSCKDAEEEVVGALHHAWQICPEGDILVSPGADQLFRQQFGAWDRAADKVGEKLSGFYARAAPLTYKIAAIYAFDRYAATNQGAVNWAAGQPPIEISPLDAIRAMILVGELHIKNVASVLGSMAGATLRGRQKQEICDVLQEEGHGAGWPMGALTKRFGMVKKDLEPLLYTLLEEGEIEELIHGTRKIKTYRRKIVARGLNRAFVFLEANAPGYADALERVEGGGSEEQPVEVPLLRAEPVKVEPAPVPALVQGAQHAGPVILPKYDPDDDDYR